MTAAEILILFSRDHLPKPVRIKYDGKIRADETMAANLTIEESDLEIGNCTYWSDSAIALWWIQMRGDGSRLSSFG
ncbi:hypothetical protein T4D_4071 [Trichinella pseudospiralis]|uniref:Uncharacterized protein n=1 Tax=Trichinella pseudospiralis TaxID=6337 RepID=A0A0V1FYG9_TRIPS|nr:hypothetical protein T4D_4071 [Trichinella pseudospiralis]